jgi:hypothetical protein
MPIAQVSRTPSDSGHSKRSGRRKVGKSRKTSQKSKRTIPLRHRIWVTTFEWAKHDLGTDTATAREIANAGVENLQTSSAR